MIKGKKISLIIPCRNEEKGLAKLLPSIPKHVDEVLVVDNNSTDKTSQVASSLGAKVVREKRVDAKGIGYGYSLRKGMKAAKGDVLVTLDGDGTYPVEEIGRAVEFLVKENADVVSCNRFPLTDGQAISPLRKLGIWILNTQVRVLYGTKMEDILSGMWIIRRGALKSLSLKEGGWDLSPEIKLSAIMNPTVSFTECHINHHRREHEMSKQRLWQTGFGHLLYILKRWLFCDNLLVRVLNGYKKGVGVDIDWTRFSWANKS